jgi:hypothetical protein
VEKALHHNPAEVQTGPAIRGDIKTIVKHQQYLHEMNEDWEEIYMKLTKGIQNIKKL